MTLSTGGIGGLGSFNVSALQQRAQSRFEQLDTNGNGSVELDEAKSGSNNPELVERAFAKFDSNGDGSISVEERKQVADQVSQKINEKLSQLGVDSQLQLSQLLFQSSEEKQNSIASSNIQSTLDVYRRHAG